MIYKYAKITWVGSRTLKIRSRISNKSFRIHNTVNYCIVNTSAKPTTGERKSIWSLVYPVTSATRRRRSPRDGKKFDYCCTCSFYSGQRKADCQWGWLQEGTSRRWGTCLQVMPLKLRRHRSVCWLWSKLHRWLGLAANLVRQSSNSACHRRLLQTSNWAIHEAKHCPRNYRSPL